MNFLKMLLGKHWKFDPKEVVAKTDAEQSFLTRIQDYTLKLEYEAALRELLSFLDEHPGRQQFALFTAATVLRNYLQNRQTGVIQELPVSILEDKRLDHIFMSCSHCFASWIPAPMSQGPFFENYHTLSSSKDGSFSILPRTNICPNCGSKSVRNGR